MRWGGRRVWAAAAIAVVFAGLGVYFLSSSRASTPGGDGGQALSKGEASGNDLLRPLPTGMTPYAYVPYGSISMPEYGERTGANQFYAAFILGKGCVPAWDGESYLGLSSDRAKAIGDEINQIRARGGDVSVSFGGESGTELANSCTDPAQLQNAYQSVIDRYDLTHINFDVEYDSESDQAAQVRRAKAAKSLQDANPGLAVSLTVPVGTEGLVDGGLTTVKRFKEAGVTISNLGIMAMIFGSSSEPEADRVISAARGTVSQMLDLYPGISESDAYKALNIIVLLGDNTNNEMFTLQDASTVRRFIDESSVGSWGYWSANRDKQCGAPGASLQGDTCSGVIQDAGAFGKAFQ